MAQNSGSTGGIGFFGLLAILFIGLKLTGTISWSWWWVLSPLWGGFAFVVVLLIIFCGVGVALEGRNNRWKKR